MRAAVGLEEDMSFQRNMYSCYLAKRLKNKHWVEPSISIQTEEQTSGAKATIFQWLLWHDPGRALPKTVCWMKSRDLLRYTLARDLQRPANRLNHSRIEDRVRTLCTNTIVENLAHQRGTTEDTSGHGHRN